MRIRVKDLCVSFFSTASTSRNGSEDDSESEEEEEQQHAPSNSVRGSHGYKCYCNRLIVFFSVQAKSAGIPTK